MLRQAQRLRLPIMLMAIGIVLLAVASAYACPTCKDGIAENDPAAQSMAAGYFYSIIFMMSMPFVLLGTLGSFAYFSIRRAQNAQDDSSASESPANGDAAL